MSFKASGSCACASARARRFAPHARSQPEPPAERRGATRDEPILPPGGSFGQLGISPPGSRAGLAPRRWHSLRQGSPDTSLKVGGKRVTPSGKCETTTRKYLRRWLPCIAPQVLDGLRRPEAAYVELARPRRVVGRRTPRYARLLSLAAWLAASAMRGRFIWSEEAEPLVEVAQDVLVIRSVCDPAGGRPQTWVLRGKQRLRGVLWAHCAGG